MLLLLFTTPLTMCSLLVRSQACVTRLCPPLAVSASTPHDSMLPTLCLQKDGAGKRKQAGRSLTPDSKFMLDKVT